MTKETARKIWQNAFEAMQEAQEQPELYELLSKREEIAFAKYKECKK